MTITPQQTPAPVAVLTGASRGLGLVLAEALSRDGWHLIVDARTAADLTGATAGWDRLTAVPGDVVDDDHRAVLAAAADRVGGADLLVNNASTLGGSPPPALADFPLPALLETFEVNVLAPIALTQLLLPQLRRSAIGAILNISSDAAVEAYAGWGGYGAAKAALDHASRVLAVEEPDLRVWAVDPGDLRTRLQQEAFPGEDISDRPLPETVVPHLLRLIRDRLPSSRYVAAALAADTSGAGAGTPAADRSGVGAGTLIADTSVAGAGTLIADTSVAGAGR
jgi:NAD(P)-dependent dehydrogenase (short-subunit alcohol dehydrogenase family)